MLAKSVRPSRIEENRHLVELSAVDLQQISASMQDTWERKEFTRFVYPSFGVNFGFPDKLGMGSQ